MTFETGSDSMAGRSGTYGLGSVGSAEGLSHVPELTIQRETFESVGQEWREMLRGHCMAVPFLTPAWLQVWWRHFSDGHELILLSFREAGILRGVAPLMRTGDFLSFTALSDVCDYHDFLFPCGSEEKFFKALLPKLLVIQGWHTLSLDGLRDNSATLAILPGVASALGLTVTVTPDEVSPHIPVASSWDTYLGSLNKKDRHELRRKLRRLETSGEVRIVSAQTETLERDVAEFLTLLKDSRDEKAAFLTMDRERFFHEVAIAMDGEGYLKLFFMELDGKRVAAAFCFDYENTYYLYNSGYDRRYASLSVGLLLKALLVKHAVDSGKRDYDLLRGAEPYKDHLGAEHRWLRKLVIERD